MYERSIKIFSFLEKLVSHILNEREEYLISEEIHDYHYNHFQIDKMSLQIEEQMEEARMFHSFGSIIQFLNKCSSVDSQFQLNYPHFIQDVVKYSKLSRNLYILSFLILLNTIFEFIRFRSFPLSVQN